MLTTSDWTHGGTGRSGLPDSHELQAWAASAGLVGVTPVPLVIAGLLAVLAVACIVGGAWGGQGLIGRQESRRCQRGRDRESQAFWRGQRLRVYATALDTFEHLADRLTADAGLGTAHPRGRTGPAPTRPDPTGPGHDRVDRRPGHRGPDQSGCGGLRDPGGPHASPALRDRIWELRAQFRTDLAIPHE